jgi:hypothetical protein
MMAQIVRKDQAKLKLWINHFLTYTQMQ